jgi:DNA topoisomerase-3
MRVVLAEKPSVARDIARVLGCSRKQAGFFEGKHLLVTWAIGHLVRIAEPAAIDPRWAKPWRREALPMLPRTWLLEPEPATEAQFRIVSHLFHDPRVTEIVNAADAGREGEAIFRRIYQLSGVSKPVLRFWASSLTDEAIAAAFARLRPSAAYDPLAASAETRARLDWLIGMNHSRATTLHNGVVCSIGRVQTPTLAMIVARHHEIEAFVKRPFHEVHANLIASNGADFVARALNPKGKYDFDHKPDAELILTAISPPRTVAHVTAVDKKPRRTPPPQLHNLGELQKEANRRFGLTADRTLTLAQSLYETHKVISYPRSSSRHLADDMVASLPAVLRALRLGPAQQPHIDAALERTRTGPKLSKRFIDSAKLSDHHAIIPTAKAAPTSLSPDERRVYNLVAERFLCIFLPDKESEDTRIDLAIANKPFRASGTRVLIPGWTLVTGAYEPSGKAEEPEDRQTLPPVSAGECLPVADAELVTKERKPPPKFTDATLLSAMETAGKQIDDEALREAMRGRGLGTEATRAAIIQRLIDLAYITRTGKFFDPTGKGIAIIAQVLPKLASPELTGAMEERLAQVEAGQLDAQLILAQVEAELQRDIPAVFSGPRLQAAPAAPIEPAAGDLLCPKCKAGLVTRRPQQDFYGCARFREGCNFTINCVIAQKLLTETNIKDLCSPTRKHRTRLIKGFVAKSGKPFDAHLTASPATDWKITFEFDR